MTLLEASESSGQLRQAELVEVLEPLELDPLETEAVYQELDRRGIELLVELYWAAGAREVYPPVEGVGILRDGDVDSLRGRDVRARDLTLAAFHPMGTARADARPEHGVVDADLKDRKSVV